MVAERGGLRTVFAAADAELVEGDEVGPFVQLLDLARKRAREDKTADGITYGVRVV